MFVVLFDLEHMLASMSKVSLTMCMIYDYQVFGYVFIVGGMYSVDRIWSVNS